MTLRWVVVAVIVHKHSIIQHSVCGTFSRSNTYKCEQVIKEKEKKLLTSQTRICQQKCLHTQSLLSHVYCTVFKTENDAAIVTINDSPFVM